MKAAVAVMPKVTRIAFEVEGIPQPQGSMKNVGRIGRRPLMVCDNPKMKPWREQVGIEALKSRPTSTIWAARHVPVKLSLYFQMPRPKKEKRPFPSVKPDIDKLCRACLDAMTGILYVDDGQVTTLIAQKTYSAIPRLLVVAETDWLL